MKTFFLDLAERGPFLIEGRDIYFLSLIDERSDYLEFLGSSSRYSLISGDTLDGILKIYYQAAKGQIYDFKKQFIEKNTGQKHLTEEERQKAVSRKRVFSFIVEELMPYMSGHKEGINLSGEDAINPEGKKEDLCAAVGESELSARLLKRIKDELQLTLGIGNNYINYGKDRARYLREFLPKDRALVLGNFVYSLPETKSESAQIQIHLNGNSKSLAMDPVASVADIGSKYNPFLEWCLKSDAVEEFSDHLKNIIQAQMDSSKDLEKIMQLREFNQGDIGFLQHEGKVYVYQAIQPFAMLDPRSKKQGTCYLFPRLRVGFQLWYEDGVLHFGNPTLIEAIQHPFAKFTKEGFQSVCAGERYDSIPTDKCSNAEYIAIKLDALKNVVMSGLSPLVIKKHSGGQYSSFQGGKNLETIMGGREATVDEAIKKGFPITNNW